MMSPNASFIQMTHKLDVRDYTTDHQQISFSKAIQEMYVLIGDTHLFVFFCELETYGLKTTLTFAPQREDQRILLWFCWHTGSSLSWSTDLKNTNGYCSQSVSLWSAVLGGSYYLPDNMNTIPAKQASFALALSEPPTLVHFIPKRAKMEPKKPRLTAAIISPLQAWM